MDLEYLTGDLGIQNPEQPLNDENKSPSDEKKTEERKIEPPEVTLSAGCLVIEVSTRTPNF